MKDIGKLIHFLEIKVTYSKQDIIISWKKYVLVLLQETTKLGCKPASILVEQNQRVSVNDESIKVDNVHYKRLVEKLIYLTHIRPNLIYIISVVSQFMHGPEERHLQVV